MSFKDDYRKYNEDIKPDKEFLDRLTDDINKEHRSRISIHRTGMITTVCAACVCLVVAGGFAFSSFASGNINISVAGEDTPHTAENTTIGVFSAQQWYSEDMSDEEITALLADRLNDANDIEKVFCSADNSFDDDELLSGDEIHKLSEKLKKAEIISPIDESGDVKYYMMVFKNGDIIKIKEYNNCILIEDTGTFCKIK